MRSNSGPVESSGLARSEWLPWSLQLASYLVCMVTAIGVVGAGAYQLAHAWAQQIVPAERRVMPAVIASAAVDVANAQPRIPARQSNLSLQAERINGDPDFWARFRRKERDVAVSKGLRDGMRLATRSAMAYRAARPVRSDDDDEEDEKPQPTFRTLCVRLCDGYYFPISFSAPRERFASDAAQCNARCGGEARLFVHANPGGTPEQMEDLAGKPYAQLPTAFLYRTQYVANCKCRPDPWEAQAREQHRIYALASAAKKGNAKAQADLKTVEVAKRSALAKASRPEGKQGLTPQERVAASIALPNERPSPQFEGGRRMGLGVASDGDRRSSQPRQSGNGLPEWARRAFQAN